ncbi:Ger(x)C family spore germination protein [Halalkalibacter alkalisediminis]|uniref:Ger(X)C family spore germination protein n=1 Tax=Halalkalibacter alkalisediminis TaxID=935616 RepID=A0ABV6NG30_9BACI|nr:Ger(x)C family spore germination protein [Halalkalibacter alkalisediminis]
MKNRCIALFFLLLLLLSLAGCWDRRELNNITIVSGMAIEQGKDETFTLTVEAINASELNPALSEGLTPTITFTLNGVTMGELLNKMNVGGTRELNFSHARTLVIDEKLAREEGVSRFLQFLEKSGQFRNDFQIVIAKDVSAKDLITTTYPIQKVPSMKMFQQFETLREQWGGVPESTLTEFVLSLTSPGKHPIVAAATIEGDPQEGKDVNDNTQLELPAIISYGGLALFKKDRLIGYLSVEEARNVMWIRDLNQTTVAAPCGKEGYFALRVFNSHTTIDTKYEGETPKVEIKLVVEGDVFDNQCARPLDSTDTYISYEEAMEDHLESKLTKTIKTVKENYGIDIFGFGEKMSKQHYKNFKEHKENWDEQFMKADITVEASVYIRRDGMRTKSFIEQLDD